MIIDYAVLSHYITETIDGDRRFYRFKYNEMAEIILIDKCGESDVSARGRVDYLIEKNKNTVISEHLEDIRAFLSYKLSNG